jgi:hypothetical protein
VEQRTDPIIQPLSAAGTDPAYVPGLAPRPPRTRRGRAGLPPAEETSPSADSASAPDATGADAPAQEPDAERVERDEGKTGKEREDREAGSEAETEGAAFKVFKVSDHRGSITADRDGITFRLDSETAEFHWGEIGAVEIDTPRFSRLFTVTVYTGSRRWYEAYVQASARQQLKEWTAELDAVLDACFDDATA